MGKADLGVKLTCPSCGARFYNLNKNPATCPKCEVSVDVQPLLKPKRSSPSEAKAAKKPVAPKVEEEEVEDDPLLDDDDDDDALEIEDDDDDSLIADTSDLDEEDDDVAEVKEHIEVDDTKDVT